MDAVIVFQKVIEFLVKIWELEFVFAGIRTSVGAVVCWSLIAGVVIAFIKR